MIQRHSCYYKDDFGTSLSAMRRNDADGECCDVDDVAKLEKALEYVRDFWVGNDVFPEYCNLCYCAKTDVDVVVQHVEDCPYAVVVAALEGR